MRGEVGGVALIGLGRIGRRLAARIAADPALPPLVGVLARPGTAAEGVPLVPDAAALLARAPAVVVECAGAATLAELGPAVLAAGADLIPLSLAAFADPAVEARLAAAAAAGPGRIELAPGAVGSLDLLAAAREDRLARVIFRAWNPAVTWRRGLADPSLAIPDRGCFFEGSVRGAARLFPRNVNVAAGVALAGLGLDATAAELHCDPDIGQAVFEVELEAGPGRALIRVTTRDAAPGTDPADYTAFSVLRLLRRRGATIRA